LRNDKGYVVDYRAVIRKTISESLHFEGFLDIGVRSESLLKGIGTTVLMRYNF